MKSLFIVCLIFSLISCSAPSSEPKTDALVATDSGRVIGTSSNSVVRWLDIPYAKAPVGDLRWRAPQPLPSSDALLTAPQDPVLCPQEAGETSGIVTGGIVGSEDCLYLDVTAPADFKNQTYPVMFWIHGGGNTSGYKGTYDFSPLVERQNVVVVTINYRLGPLGWFVHPALSDPSDQLDASGNFGTLDIIAALKWTQRNIQRFGGDAANITIFGESAGGQNVLSMLASPMAAGLFHKAIAQSPVLQSYSLEQAHNAEKQFAQVDRGSWEVINNLSLDNTAVTSQELRSIRSEELLKEYYGIFKDHASPLVLNDGVVIPENGLMAALGDTRVAKNIPVLIGSNRDEVTLWLGLSRYFVDADEILFGLLPPKLRIKDPEVFNYWVKQRGRGWKVRGVDAPLLALRSAGYDGLYGYRFDWDEQADNWFVRFSKLLGAAHASEIAFVMGAPMYGSIGDYMYPDSESAQTLTNAMMQAWASFAREGKPGSINGIHWPEFSDSSREVMVLDAGAEQARLVADSPGLHGLLDEVASTPSKLNPIETCMLVWELTTTIGDPAYSAYKAWNEGQCAAVDVPKEKANIRAALVEEYGSADVL